MTQEKLLALEIPSEVNKASIAALAEKVVKNSVEEGTVLKVAEGLSVMEKLVKAVREDESFVDSVVEELQKNKTAVITNNGTKIEVCEVGTKYDFSHNPQWVELDEEIKQLTKRKKDLEESLKRIGAGKLMVDESTGETLSGAAKTSKTSYRITLKK